LHGAHQLALYIIIFITTYFCFL